MFSIKSQENGLNSIYGVFRPLYIVARIFGFFPFSVKIQLSGKNSKIYFTFIDFVILMIHLTVYTFFAYLNINHNYNDNTAASPLLILGTRILLILGISNGIICLLADLCHRYEIVNIFDQFQDFDVQMRALGSFLNYKKLKRCINLSLLAWALISLIYYSLSSWFYFVHYNLESIAVIYSSYFILNNVFGVILSIYSFFLFSVKSRYCMLNWNLSQLLIESNNLKVITTLKRNTVGNVMKLADLHDMLNNILEKVNNCYSIQAMLSVGMNFTFMVFSLFSCYRGWIIRIVDDYKPFYFAIIVMMWSSFYNFFVLTVLWAGHSTRNEGKFTGILVHRAINRCYNTEIVGRLLAFSQQINHRVPDANCKLFSFDWTLFYSIVAATATYLIILIQFDASGSAALPTLPSEAGNFSTSN